jgi:hypothetical protein
MAHLTRWLAVLAAPLLLTSCLLVPTRFNSTLDIKADRTFTFTYLGEVQLAKQSKPDDPPAEATEEEGGTEQSWRDSGDDEARMIKIATPSKARGKAAKPDETSGDTPEDATKLRDLAKTLSAEYGFRSVRYIGNRKLAVDYRITGRLDHAFVFPFNPDGEVMFPFLAIELRGKDRLRVKAPGFSNDQSAQGSMGGMGGMGGGSDGPGSQLDGSFTITTTAEVVSQNQEEGAIAQPDGSRKIVWKVSPSTKDAPMAVLRVVALP